MKAFFLQVFATVVTGNGTCQRFGCMRGFELRDGQCVDIDECTNSPCDANAYCLNTQGKFNCNCKKGYEGTGFQCKPYKVSVCKRTSNN